MLNTAFKPESLKEADLCHIYIARVTWILDSVNAETPKSNPTEKKMYQNKLNARLLQSSRITG